MKINKYYESVVFDERRFKMSVKHNVANGVSDYVPENFLAHWHEHIEILFFKVGGSFILVGEELIKAEDGDIFIINPSEIHVVKYGKKISEFYFYLISPTFFGSEADDIYGDMWKKIVNREIQFKHLIRNDEKARRILTDIINEYENKEKGYQLAIKGMIYDFYAYLYRKYSYTKDVHVENSTNNSIDERFKSILSYIEENYKSDLSLVTLSRLYGVEKSYFCRLFKKMTGTTVSAYVNDFRMILAERELLDTDKTISDIAADVGYGDVAYFSRTFKKKFGISPKVYRQK